MNQISSKRLVLTFIAGILNFHSMLTLADATTERETGKFTPKNPDEIAKNIYDLVTHDELADEQYYSEKMDVVMKGGEKGWVKDPAPCGLALIPKIDLKLEQRFSYSEIPWFFNKNYGRNFRCDQPYIKEFLPNGKIAVRAGMEIDFNKACITKGDLKKYFTKAIFSPDRGGFTMKYLQQGENSIYIEIWSTALEKKCVTSITLKQNSQ
ncbi:hypothetical protein [Paraburkholderia sp. D1E]|uniref:hypothetical protein n=1 Tax=Paraburkholderia sp. D1E TaxID=3461398 RepID=UPI0040453A66